MVVRTRKNWRTSSNARQKRDAEARLPNPRMGGVLRADDRGDVRSAPTDRTGLEEWPRPVMRPVLQSYLASGSDAICRNGRAIPVTAVLDDAALYGIIDINDTEAT